MLLARLRISGHSMEPTITSGQEVLVSSVPYYFSPPQRHDLVVLRHPLDHLIIIKRITSLPGEQAILPAGTVRLQSDEYIVLGDNPQDSSDSRHFGPIHRNQILGKVITIL